MRGRAVGLAVAHQGHVRHRQLGHLQLQGIALAVDVDLAVDAAEHTGLNHPREVRGPQLQWQCRGLDLDIGHLVGRFAREHHAPGGRHAFGARQARCTVKTEWIFERPGNLVGRQRQIIQLHLRWHGHALVHPHALHMAELDLVDQHPPAGGASCCCCLRGDGGFGWCIGLGRVSICRNRLGLVDRTLRFCGIRIFLAVSGRIYHTISYGFSSVYYFARGLGMNRLALRIQQTQLPIFATFDRQVGAIQRHLADVYQPCQRLHFCQLHVQLLPRQQLVIAAIVHLHTAGVDIASQRDLGLAGLRKRHFQIGIEPPRHQLNGHRSGDIGQIWLQIQIADLKIGVCLAVVGKGRAFRLAGKLAAIQIKRQLWQNLDGALRLEIADKGDAQVQVLERMGLAHRIVAKQCLTVLDLDVVERKVRGLAVIGRRVGVVQLGQNIVKVKLARRGLRHAQHRLVHLDRIEHRRQAEQRLHIGIHIHTLDRQLRLAARLAPGNLQVTQRQLKRPGLELHRANVHGAAQLFARHLRALRAQQPRQCQPRQRPQQQKRHHAPRQAAQPAHASALCFLRCLCFAHSEGPLSGNPSRSLPAPPHHGGLRSRVGPMTNPTPHLG